MTRICLFWLFLERHHIKITLIRLYCWLSYLRPGEVAQLVKCLPPQKEDLMLFLQTCIQMYMHIHIHVCIYIHILSWHIDVLVIPALGRQGHWAASLAYSMSSKSVRDPVSNKKKIVANTLKQHLRLSCGLYIHTHNNNCIIYTR